MERTLRERIDPSLSAANLSEIGSRALGLSVHARSAEILTGGCWNRVVAVRYDRDAPELVLKISAHRKAPEIEREFLVLRHFAEKTRMPVPRPYLVDASCSVIPGTLLVMERLPGLVLHAAFGELSPRARSEVLAQIGAHVISLHELHATGFGGVELREGELASRWPDFWMPRFRKVLEEAQREGNLSAAFLGRVERVSERLDAILDVGARSTLTHYDVWSGNVMVEPSPEGARVSGFIDVPGYWADPAREISFMEMFGLADERFARRYHGAYPADPGFELRKAVYNLKMHMKHVSMYPDEGYYRRGAEECLRAIERSA